MATISSLEPKWLEPKWLRTKKYSEASLAGACLLLALQRALCDPIVSETCRGPGHIKALARMVIEVEASAAVAIIREVRTSSW